MKIIDRKLRKYSNKLYKNLIVDLQKEIELLEEKYDVKIYILGMCCSKKTSLKAMYLFSNIIVFDSMWIYRLLDSYPTNTTPIKIAFYQTLGHELAHKDKDYKFFEILSRDKKFVNWVSEVHADFESGKKIFDKKREKLITAIGYKKTNKGNRDRDSISHPSWGKRFDYISEYNFDENLIKIIAKEVGCTNENLISSVIDYYKSIYLC